MARVAKLEGIIPATKLRAKQRILCAAAGRALCAVLLLCLISLAGGCSSTGPRAESKRAPDFPPELAHADFVRPDFAEYLTNHNRAAIVSPDVFAERTTLWRHRKLSDKSATDISAKLLRLVGARLQQNGFVIQTSGVNTTNSTVSADLKQWMDGPEWGGARFHGSVTNTGVEASSKIIADDAQADVLVCIKFTGGQTSFARRARGWHAQLAGCVGAVAMGGGVLAGLVYAHAGGDSGGAYFGLAALGAVGGYFGFRELAWWITGGGSYEENGGNHATLQVVILEGATGNVLWANTESSDSPKDIGFLVDRVFLNFPK